MNWENMSIEAITSGLTPDGSPLLQSFLNDYKRIFYVQTVNPACPSCLKAYHEEYKSKFRKMENKSKYELHKKRENLPLKFGSPIVVNNSNITDEYAEILLERYSKIEGFVITDLFSKYPKKEQQQQDFQKKKKHR